jgi:formylglycine-generating enzyme required for sulfatase activity
MPDANRPREPEDDPQAALRRKLQKLVESGALSPEELNLLVAGDGAAASTGGTAAGRGGAAVGRDVQGNVTVYNIEVDRYRDLEFQGMGVTDRVALQLPLLDMYVPLKARVETPQGETWYRVAGRAASEEEKQSIGEKLSEPKPVLNLLRRKNGLVVLGDPGAGKSTFLKYLALSLASGQDARLKLGTRLPVLLPLSAYAEALAEKDVPLPDFIARHYRDRGVDLPVGAVLERALAQGGALLLFDGLDEVKDFQQRRLVVDRVQDFYSVHRRAGNKFVLTSRIVGYREVRPQAESLAECTLVDFDEKEIEAFADKWTRAVEKAVRGATRVARLEAKREKEDLLSAVHGNPGVRSLAANPLLLTILALMKRQGVSLPERRVELYQTYIETLLRNWNLARSLSGRSGRDLDVVETLKILPPLALWMHETSPAVGLVKEGDLRRRLEEIFREREQPDPEGAARRFLEDVREHAALLLDRGGRQFGFIHLTFQEYLAAVALARRGQQGAGLVVDALAPHVGEAAWREVILLTIGYLGIVQQWEQVAGEVLEELIRREPGPPGQAVVLAGLAVADAGQGGVTPSCRGKVVEALLETIRAGGKVAPRLRVAAGVALAGLGDPRPEVMRLDGMQFCWVPPGPFRMGSRSSDEIAYKGEKPLHECDVPYGYWIGRYPVTEGQACEFLEEARIPRLHKGASFSSLPAVWVEWAEAWAFCDWLTESWRRRGLISRDLVVALPSEAEWEKAARGGLEIPAQPWLRTVGHFEPCPKTLENPLPERRFPWGDEADSDKANSFETGVQSVSPVGCFPEGASPHGCEEMSGNVWEWTRSLEGGYPYPEEEGRRAREDRLASGLRVWRGGSCINISRLSRCAYRNRDDPAHRYRRVGFRVVILPVTP